MDQNEWKNCYLFPLTLKTPHGVISGNVTKTIIYDGDYNFNTALQPGEMGPVQKTLNHHHFGAATRSRLQNHNLGAHEHTHKWTKGQVGFLSCCRSQKDNAPTRLTSLVVWKKSQNINNAFNAQIFIILCPSSRTIM